jgi:hypothetical protein
MIQETLLGGNQRASGDLRYLSLTSSSIFPEISSSCNPKAFPIPSRERRTWNVLKMHLNLKWNIQYLGQCPRSVRGKRYLIHVQTDTHSSMLQHAMRRGKKNSTGRLDRLPNRLQSSLNTDYSLSKSSLLETQSSETPNLGKRGRTFFAAARTGFVGMRVQSKDWEAPACSWDDERGTSQDAGMYALSALIN